MTWWVEANEHKPFSRRRIDVHARFVIYTGRNKQDIATLEHSTVRDYNSVRHAVLAWRADNGGMSRRRLFSANHLRVRSVAIKPPQFTHTGYRVEFASKANAEGLLAPVMGKDFDTLAEATAAIEALGLHIMPEADWDEFKLKFVAKA